MSEMPSVELDACRTTLDYHPVDPKLSARLVRCTRPDGHLGLHRGDDGLPFGPAVTCPAPPEGGRP